MAFTTPAGVGGAAARDLTQALTRRKFDVRSKIVEVCLILATALSLLILLILILDLIVRGAPIWAERPWGFLTGT
ncbi:MAG: hypothetical protein ACO23O_02855 [Ilumatobacteraceae bacterium]